MNKNLPQYPNVNFNGMTDRQLIGLMFHATACLRSEQTESKSEVGDILRGTREWEAHRTYLDKLAAIQKHLQWIDDYCSA